MIHSSICYAVVANDAYEIPRLSCDALAKPPLLIPDVVEGSNGNVDTVSDGSSLLVNVRDAQASCHG